MMNNVKMARNTIIVKKKTRRLMNFENSGANRIFGHRTKDVTG
jgi:hypothetical protein